MNKVYLLLGGNAGDRLQYLNSAMAQIVQNCGTITHRSHIYETAAWGLTEQPDFLNMVIQVATELPPTEVLQAIQSIENNLGRQRDVKWGQRTLDIDILFYNLNIVNTPELQIPHPHMQDRLFVLMPLAELAPELKHPVLQKTTTELLAACPDQSAICRLQSISEI